MAHGSAATLASSDGTGAATQHAATARIPSAHFPRASTLFRPSNVLPMTRRGPSVSSMLPPRRSARGPRSILAPACPGLVHRLVRRLYLAPSPKSSGDGTGTPQPRVTLTRRTMIEPKQPGRGIRFCTSSITSPTTSATVSPSTSSRAIVASSGPSKRVQRSTPSPRHRPPTTKTPRKRNTPLNERVPRGSARACRNFPRRYSS